MFRTNEAIIATISDLLPIDIKSSKLQETNELKVNPSRNATHRKQKSIIEFVCTSSQSNETPADSPTSTSKRKRSEKDESESESSDLLLEAVNTYKLFEKQTFAELKKAKKLRCQVPSCKATNLSDRGATGNTNTFGFREKSIRCNNLSCHTSTRLRRIIENTPELEEYHQKYLQLDKELTDASTKTSSLSRKLKIRRTETLPQNQQAE